MRPGKSGDLLFINEWLTRNWKWLETFVRVAESGSLTSAAHLLGTSQPTASRAVAALEDALGARLLVRHSRGLGLTERGAELLADAKRLDDGVQALFRRAAGLREAPKGTVRLSANEPLGVRVLPCLNGFGATTQRFRSRW